MSLTAVPDAMLNTTSTAMPATTLHLGTYPLAIFLAIFALLLSLLILPPMLWHARNRNIGATSLIFWILLLNLQILTNALIWRSDDIPHWFAGAGLCDIETKIQIASEVGFPASAACVLKALARVMDTEKVTLSSTKAQRRRAYAIDLLWCVGLPALQMLFHYIVQTRRYYIYGISGCVPPVSRSWVRDLLITAPPLIWTLICAFYAALVLLRLHRYRRTFTTLLAHSNTNKSRFLRLFILCLAWLAVSIPLEGYVLSQQIRAPHEPFVWAQVHDPALWSVIEMVPSNGSIIYVRWVWLGAGVCVFLFFGFGRDATTMYANGLRAVGLARCFPALKAGRASTRAASAAGTFTSVSSKAKLLFTSRSKSVSPTASQKTWATDSRVSDFTASADAEPVSPRTTMFLDPVREEPRQQEGGSEKKPGLSSWVRAHAGPRFKKPAYDVEQGGARIPMGEVVRQHGSPVPSLARGFETPPEVHVKKEFRVSSESA